MSPTNELEGWASEVEALEYAGAIAWSRAAYSSAGPDEIEVMENDQFARREALGTMLSAVPGVAVDRARLERAGRIAEIAHHGQVDKVGNAYIGHPHRVAERLDADDLEGRAVALLHDVLEDGPEHHPPEEPFLASMAVIAEQVGPQIAIAVHLLTRAPALADDDYYVRIRRNGLAHRVKLADLADNSDPARLARLSPEEQDRLTAKYAHGRELLGST